MNVQLSLDAVGFAYADGTEALRDLTIGIESGSRIAFIGPSGCGKSTLLSVVAGLIDPTAGSIAWAGPAGPPRLTMMFQRETLLPWLTVAKNVELAAQLRRRRHDRKHALELLQLVRLADAADKYPYQLSGGMRRRVQFLSAIAPEPNVLLLDEPFSALDEPSRLALHQDVLRICADRSMTVVLVTHDLAEAITLSDEIVILTGRPGKVSRRFTMPFGRERDVMQLREERAFHDMYAEVWHELRAQIDASAEASEA